MKNIPNTITSIRLISAIVIASTSLFATDHGSHYFLPLFVAAAISDMLDGYIARRFDWCTKFGATLDSISDLALYAAAATHFALTSPRTIIDTSTLITIGTLVQVFHILYSLKRFRTFPAYHTDFSRWSAYSIFFLVLAFSLLKFSDAFQLIAILWTLCSIEGIAITAILKASANDLHGITEAIRMSLTQQCQSNTGVQA